MLMLEPVAVAVVCAGQCQSGGKEEGREGDLGVLHDEYDMWVSGAVLRMH